MSEQPDQAETAVPAPSAESPKVVVGFDNSEHAIRAVDVAGEEAARRGATLEILCGWPWRRTFSPADADEARTLKWARLHLDEVAERVRTAHPHVPVLPSLTSAAAAEALLRSSRDAALTVVGTRGHGGFVGLLLGSVSLRVATHTTTPLLVVGPKQEPEAREGPEVLVAMKSDADADALRYGFVEAERRGTALRVLHTWQYTPYPGDIQDTAAATALISTAVEEQRKQFPDVQTDFDDVQERAAKALVEASGGADVLVLATHRRKHRLGMRLGPVVHAVLSHARCPVVLVPVGS